MKKKRIIVAFFMVLLCTMAIGMSAFAAETTLKNKKWVTGQGSYYVDTNNDGVADDEQDKGDIYYKIKVPKTGFLKVEVKVSDAPGRKEYYADDIYEDAGEASTSVTILNAKKELYGLKDWDSEIDEESNGTLFAAVKKGTYFVEINGDQKYRLRYTFKPAGGKLSKAGKKASKAVKLAAGKTVKRFLDAKFQTDYYKISLTKDREITLTFNVYDTVGLRIFKKKGHKLVQVDKNGKEEKQNNDYAWWEEMEGDGKLEMETVKFKLKKGTYYLEIFSSIDPAYYTMKWQ